LVQPHYDVALSYASEQESYVHGVAHELKQRGINVWFAPYEEVKLWGEDLIPYLQGIYRDLAKLCVMFIPKAYVEKAWPRVERQAALARQMQSDEVYILPVRFDDSVVPGLPTSIGYVSAKNHDAVKMAILVEAKLTAFRPK
jgi:hypothetical protein